MGIRKESVRTMTTGLSTQMRFPQRVAGFVRRGSLQGRPTMPFRTMFIQTKDSPNPNSLMFYPGKEIISNGTTYDFATFKSAQISPLASSVFAVDGVKRVFLGEDFLSVTIKDDGDWLVIKPHVFAAIMDFYSSDKAVITGEVASENEDTQILDTDDEAVALIKEIIETRVRPHVQGDGGDIKYIKFEKGVVYLQLQGSCAGCPSSSVTLKHGIENMMMHYVEEVQAVEEWIEEDEEGDGSVMNATELEKLQEGLSQVKQT